MSLHQHIYNNNNKNKNNNNKNDDDDDDNIGVPANARYLLGVSYPSSERQHVLTMKTLSCTPGVCADGASAIDALAPAGCTSMLHQHAAIQHLMQTIAAINSAVFASVHDIYLKTQVQVQEHAHAMQACNTKAR